MERLVIDWEDAVNACPERKWSLERYNEGWVKHVTGLDKTRDDGYSLLGEFVRRTCGLTLLEPGLYVDCDIRGTRKRPRRYYQLFDLRPNGTLHLLDWCEQCSDWAISLWPIIEQWLIRQSRPEARLEQVAAEIAALEARLAALREEREALMRETQERPAEETAA